MDLGTIVKLVDAGFTANEIRAWAVAKQAATRPARPSRSRPRPTNRPQPTQEAAVLQELPASLPINTVSNGVAKVNLNIRRSPGRPRNVFGAADMSEVPKEVTDYLNSVLESSPGTNLVSYDELKERVLHACPDYKSSIYRAVKGLFPTVTHTRQDGRGPYVLTDVAWRRR